MEFRRIVYFRVVLENRGKAYSSLYIMNKKTYKMIFIYLYINTKQSIVCYTHRTPIKKIYIMVITVS